MTNKEFREPLHASPFRAYTICLADGRELRVVHPDFVAVGPQSREAVVYGEEGECNLIDLLLVVAIRIEGGPEMARHTPP